MQFRPFVYDAMNRQVPVAIEPMTPQDAALTDREPLWQTSWASEYLADENYEKYAARVGDELIALAAYEVLPTALVVHIVYMEAQPESNPTLDGGTPKYRGSWGMSKGAKRAPQVGKHPAIIRIARGQGKGLLHLVPLDKRRRFDGGVSGPAVKGQ